MRRAWCLCIALACAGCEVTLYEFRETHEPACEKAGVPRECLCEDGTWGEAACYGANDSGPCDCVGSAPGGGVLQVEVGGAHVCAVLDDGRATCWGENRHGQLGDGTRTDHRSPTEVPDLDDIVSVALGGGTASGHTCAVDGDGHLRCWGLDDQGQLGDGLMDARAEPFELALEDVRAVAAGTLHTCAADVAGRVYCWGWDEALEAEPLAASISEPALVEGVEDVVALALGHQHTCALTGGGEVWCWGDDAQGQLGDGKTSRRATPRRVEDLPLAQGVAAGYAHGCALGRDESVWCWGEDDRGQLGDGVTDASGRLPVRVRDLPAATGIAAGWRHTCALLADGRLQCWGANDAGQLGDDSVEGRLRPTNVKSIEGAVHVAAGVHTTCARTRGERLYCWGDNHAGQIGDGTDQDRHLPTPVRWQLGDVTDADAGQE